DSTHSRRTVFSYLKDKDAVTILFREVSEKVANRPGGYTRIIKLANRLGDNSEMAIIELVDYNDVYTKGEAKVEKKATRRRGSSKKKAETSGEAVAEVTNEDASENAAPSVEETEVQSADETEVKPEASEDKKEG